VLYAEGFVSIDQRPAYIDKRRQPGHREGNLVLFAKYGQAFLLLMIDAFACFG
jgi:IS30 family transposase